jgi:hypothetical protein
MLEPLELVDAFDQSGRSNGSNSKRPFALAAVLGA